MKYVSKNSILCFLVFAFLVAVFTTSCEKEEVEKIADTKRSQEQLKIEMETDADVIQLNEVSISLMNKTIEKIKANDININALKELYRDGKQEEALALMDFNLEEFKLV